MSWSILLTVCNLVSKAVCMVHASVQQLLLHVPQAGKLTMPCIPQPAYTCVICVLFAQHVAVRACFHHCADTQTCLQALLAATQPLPIPAALLSQQRPQF